MKIYLAARYSRRLELCVYRNMLQDLGHTVTSTWLNGDHQISDAGIPLGEDGTALLEGDDGSTTDKAAELRDRFANEDMQDLLNADAVIAFTEPPRSGHSRGGRHVELGIAIASNKTIYVVGFRENIFCWLKFVRFHLSFDAVIEDLNKCQCCGASTIRNTEWCEECLPYARQGT